LETEIKRQGIKAEVTMRANDIPAERQTLLVENR
jgi:hypothetical protein